MGGSNKVTKIPWNLVFQQWLWKIENKEVCIYPFHKNRESWLRKNKGEKIERITNMIPWPSYVKYNPLAPETQL